MLPATGQITDSRVRDRRSPGGSDGIFCVRAPLYYERSRLIVPVDLQKIYAVITSVRQTAVRTWTLVCLWTLRKRDYCNVL